MIIVNARLCAQAKANNYDMIWQESAMELFLTVNIQGKVYKLHHVNLYVIWVCWLCCSNR